MTTEIGSKYTMGLKSLFIEMIHTNNASVEPNCEIIPPGFTLGQDHDAHELFSAFYNEETNKELYTNCFGTNVKVNSICTACGAKKSIKTPIFEFLVDIENVTEPVNITNLFKNLLTERVELSDYTYCNDCNAEWEIRKKNPQPKLLKQRYISYKQIEIMENLPKYLMLMVNIFQQRPNIRKIVKDIAIDEVLEQIVMQGNIRVRYIYELYSVVAHIGHNLNDGHYITFAKSKHDRNWILFDDSNVVKLLSPQYSDIFGRATAHCAVEGFLNGKITPYIICYRQISCEDITDIIPHIQRMQIT